MATTIHAPIARTTGVAFHATSDTPVENEVRRGWPAILACFCVAVFSWGFGFYGQAVVVAELHRTQGWSLSTVTTATTFYYLCGACLIPFVQQMLDRLGPRVMLTCGAVLLGLGAIGFSHAQARWQLFASGLVLAAGWAVSSGPAIATTLALWFDRRRGFAISLALNGASASGFIVAPILVHLSQAIGPRLAVIECVLAGWLILLPIVWSCARPPLAAQGSCARPPLAAQGSFARTPSAAQGSFARPPSAAEGACARPNPRGAVAVTGESRSGLARSWRFWSVALPFALAIAAQVGFILHMVSFLLPLVGPAGTSLAVTCSSIAAMAGRLALGAVIDRLPRRGTSAISFASQACGLGLLLAFPHSVAAIYCGIVLFGLSVGNVITLPAVIVHAEFDAASFGVVIGLSGAIMQFALAFAPGAFGVLHDATGNYHAVLLVCIALQLAAGGLIVCPRRSAV